MINEYMCSNFIAKTIINEVAPAFGDLDEPRKGKLNKKFVSRRVSNTQLNSILTGKKKTRSVGNAVQDTMLFDAGSRGYRDWLTK